MPENPMPEPPVIVGSGTVGSRRALWLSLAGHGAVLAVIFALGWWKDPRTDAFPAVDTVGMEVDLVVEPKPEAPKPEAPKPEMPKPEVVTKLDLSPPILSSSPVQAAPKQAPKRVRALPPRRPSVVPTPPPVLPPSPSSIPKPKKIPSLPAQKSGFAVADMGKTPSSEAGGVEEQAGAPLAPSDRDFILRQILRYLQPNVGIAAREDSAIVGYVIVQADGMLGAPFNANENWDPQAAMPQYAQAQRDGDVFTQRALESFYLALRMAQPLTLPPGTDGQWPKRISVSVKLKDAF